MTDKLWYADCMDCDWESDDFDQRDEAEQARADHESTDHGGETPWHAVQRKWRRKSEA